MYLLKSVHFVHVVSSVGSSRVFAVSINTLSTILVLEVEILSGRKP